MAFAPFRALPLPLLLGAWALYGCSSAPHVASASAAEGHSGGESPDLSGLVAENEAMHERIDDLESRLARVEQQNDQLRQALARATETRSLRIGSPAAEPPEVALLDAAVEEAPEAPEVDASGSRPVLRLHGPAVDPARPALAAASPLAGPAAPLVVAPPPLGSLGRLVVTGDASEVPAIPLLPLTVLPPAAPEVDAVALEYQSALQRLADHDLDGALDALESFVTRHPGHPYADNALYFRGEVFYARHDWRSAIETLERLVTSYPAGGRVADALLRIGTCWERLGDSDRAARYFSRVRAEHPDSSAARMAEREDT